MKYCICFLLRVNDPVQVRFHQVCDYVDVFIACACCRAMHILQGNDVFMVEEAEQFDFSQDALGVYEVFKGVGDLFDCHFGVGFPVKGTHYDSVSALADFLDVLVATVYCEGRPAGGEAH